MTSTQVNEILEYYGQQKYDGHLVIGPFFLGEQAPRILIWVAKI